MWAVVLGNISDHSAKQPHSMIMATQAAVAHVQRKSSKRSPGLLLCDVQNTFCVLEYGGLGLWCYFVGALPCPAHMCCSSYGGNNPRLGHVVAVNAQITRHDSPRLSTTTFSDTKCCALYFFRAVLEVSSEVGLL